ncbi:TetR/AcrR family transcriptional regulator [Desmospora profundinema]|uniref:AcrR family transcriptional regulator n=1 Tax=Desmospora profundinema TaxID=1571184 RepID=A0ABU1ILJ4_9BACL|nr:helix-turn-helix domain-containing protein [Desmospora profundinema]MDR6225649.1 AcrR family transcriptional regulator [Desmospora profundinema]
MSRRRIVDRLEALDCARRLFAEQGYESVSMRKIATELGYTHKALYYHFIDKADLIRQLLDRDVAWMHSELTASCGKGARTFLLHWMRLGLDHPRHHQLLFDGDPPGLGTYPREKREELFRLLAAAWGEGEGVFNPAARKRAWFSYLAVRGWISQHTADGLSWEACEESAEEFVEMVLKGLTEEGE